MEDFAVTLDTVIGQAFEEWVPSRASTRGSPPEGAAPTRPARGTEAGAGGVQQAAVAAEQWGDFDLPSQSGKERAVEGQENQAARGNAPRDPPRPARLTSFMSKIDAASQQDVQEWRLRAQQLANELQRLRMQQEEYQRLQ